MRGQANLPALAVALLVLTAVVGASLTIADGAYASADREPEQRRLAVALSEQLVSPESPLTARANVLNETALDALDADRLDDRFPFVEAAAVRIRVGGEPVVERGTVEGGATIRRIVLVEERKEVRIEPPLSPPNYTTTLPRRTARAVVHVDVPPATEIRTVRANDRVVLHDPDGLDGDIPIRLSRFETTRLAFDVDGPLPPGSVAVTYYPANTTKAVMEVTVRD
jgi:hypothetical protein